MSPRAAALALLAAGLTACAVGPNYVKPEAPVAPSFSAAAADVYSPGDVPQQYWTQFADPTLDQLIADALEANHDLRIALSRLTEARALYHEREFDLAPTVTASGGYTKERFSQLQSPTGQALTESFYDAGFDAFWELDFFGRVRRQVQSGHAQVQAAQASLRDAQVSVTGELARTYFELRGQQLELAVARRNVENQGETLEITRARLEAGRGTEFDTARAQAQLSGTLATIPPLEAAIARSIHRLAVLTGRAPDALDARLASARELPPLPALSAIGDPAGLLRRRPDIRVAERQLAAATADVGVAIADYFPHVTFTGNYTYTAAEIGAFGQSPTVGYLIGPRISWAAFDLGRVHARVSGSRAREAGALAGYEQSVLRALEETEDALVTHARTRQSLTDAEAAARSSRTAAQIARERYEGGVADFLDVLDAERTQLAAEDSLAQSRTAAATSLVALYKALGGGWEMAPSPRSAAR
ncbi:MAG TPA: efflux transporter outer membrane subunit [Steroidobacteraceae bacterium]|nr:efflux transporter outer membrane subunit [Steroidobacteraceae bacterium]